MDFRTTFRPVTVQPEQIEQKSFQIIDEEIGEHSFSNEQYAVVQRVIHASADFELGKSLLFHPRAIEAGISAIRAGKKSSLMYKWCKLELIKRVLKNMVGVCTCIFLMMMS
ncbi:precorrin-8X methylmutase [Anoxybacillus sp. BCO1]|nr:precorrin-8X methylmutase [Anoxybacillus sp. BCO1]